MSARIYIEGGGDSKDLRIRCRSGFSRLLEKCGFAGRMPRLVACGPRSATFDTFIAAHVSASEDDYVAILIDSEDPMRDIDETWAHLAQRDQWTKPDGAADEQVLLMVTCMESWIICDRSTLQDHYGTELQESALPARVDIESRPRDAVQEGLIRATRNCKNTYAKGKQSFMLLAKLDPAILRRYLPSFVRFERVLNEKL